MIVRFAVLAAFAVLLTLPASLTAQTPEEQQQLDWVLERGRLLFALDRAAWVATDDMREQIEDPAAAGLRGYIVDADEQGLFVIFFAESPSGPTAAYLARIGTDGVASREVFEHGSRPPLTERQTAMAGAIETARRLKLRSCVDRGFNPLVIPPKTTDDPIEIYLMTPQLGHAIPLGIHYRTAISPDGEVADPRPFTNSCLLLDNPPEAVGLFVTHLLDPLPTEIHVFTAMAAKVPITVGIGDPLRAWEVTGNGIKFIPLNLREE